MKQHFCAIALIILVTGIFNTNAVAENLTIAGTGDCQEVVRELALLFEKTHPGDHVTVPDSVGSGGGIKLVIQGKAGMARTARPLKSKEQKHGLTEIPFALSAVVFAANKNMKIVKNISLDDAVKLYNGKITNWSELGGENHKVYPVNRETGDSSRKVIDSYFKAVSGAATSIEDGGKTFFTTQEAAEAIAQNPYTIGYVPLSVAKKMQLHILSLDSVYPTDDNVQDKKYPLITSFYLVTPADPSALATTFIDFLQESTAQELMRSRNTIPVKQSSN